MKSLAIALAGLCFGFLLGFGVGLSVPRSVTKVDKPPSERERTIALLKEPEYSSAGHKSPSDAKGVLLVLAEAERYFFPRTADRFQTHLVFCVGEYHSSFFQGIRPGVPVRLRYIPLGIGEFYVSEGKKHASVSEGVALVRCQAIRPESEL